MSVTSFFAHCLRRANEAEVELGRLASEKAQNEDVKQFAQMMVEHHTQMIGKLQPFEARGQGAPGQVIPGQAIPGQPLPGQGAAREGALRERVGQSEPDSQDLAASDDQPKTRRGQGNVRNSESGTDGEQRPEGAPAAGGASQATTTAGQTPGTTVPGTPRTTAGQAVAGQAVPGQVVPGQAIAGQPRAGMMGGQVPHQVIAVLDQKGDIELQMTKEMLQEHEGQDFEMGYLGQQIVAHTCMLAELQALKNSGPQELQQLVTEGEKVAREHLDKAKQLAKQLKDKGDSTESPTRSARTPSTQPSSSQPEKK